MTKEREDFTERYKEVEKVNDDLRSGKWKILFVSHVYSFL
jgi:hypothetical protein